MKKLRTIVMLLITVLFSNLIYGQDSQRDFSEILQTYYLHKDKDLVEKTIEFVNNPKVNPDKNKQLFIFILNYISLK